MTRLISPEGDATPLRAPPGDILRPFARIEAYRGGDRIETGTAFWASGAPGVLLTAAHVVERADAVLIRARRTGGGIVTFDGATLAISSNADVAAICPLRSANLQNPPVLFEPADEQAVKIVGFPGDDEPSKPPQSVRATAFRNDTMLKLTKAGDPGMSGGAVLLSNGSAVGVYIGPMADGFWAVATSTQLFGGLIVAASNELKAMLGG